MSIAQDERAGLAADLSRLGPDAPTLCKGWTARDLLTHLLLRENDPLAVPGMAVNVFDAVTQARADRLEASGSFENLVARFAHGPGRFSELRLADIIRKYGRALARRSPVGVRVEMTGQTDPVTLHPGDRIVTLVGKPSEVILLLTGRTSVAQVDVLGEPPTIAAFMRSDRSL